jgi:hypothetical protein
LRQGEDINLLAVLGGVIPSFTVVNSTASSTTAAAEDSENHNQIPEAEAEAEVKVEEEEEEEEEEEKENATKTSTNTKEARNSPPTTPTKKPKDPLRWFGLLTPMPLRKAQTQSIRAVEHVIPRLASVSAEMAEVEIEVRRARKRRAKKAEASSIRLSTRGLGPGSGSSGGAGDDSETLFSAHLSANITPRKRRPRPDAAARSNSGTRLSSTSALGDGGVGSRRAFSAHLNTNITPRSSSRQSRFDSANSTPSGTPTSADRSGSPWDRFRSVSPLDYGNKHKPAISPTSPFGRDASPERSTTGAVRHNAIAGGALGSKFLHASDAKPTRPKIPPRSLSEKSTTGSFRL